MVYDVSRNYIGDMHWRENEILHDGDEFELDRGVLIQVGEATGSIDQDLTGLFEKRKKAPEMAVHEEVQSQPIVVSTARLTAVQPSQLRPKTLNALLGTPKGRLGRAAFPSKSPHELRTESENLCWDQDRPAKRQRIESQLERRVQTNRTLPRLEHANPQAPHEGMNGLVVGAVFDKRHEEKLLPTNLRDSGRPNAGDPVEMLPSLGGPRRQLANDDEVSQRIIEPLSKKRSSASGSSESAAQQKRRSHQDVQVSPRATKDPRRPSHELETGYASTSAITKPIEITSGEDATPTNEAPKQRAKLQMASRKPRRKLMYRDLLPQESSGVNQSSDESSLLERSSSKRSSSSKPEKQRRDPMTASHKEEQDRSKDRLNRHRAKEIQRNTEREQFCGDAPQDLFLSQEPIDTDSANHHRTKEAGQKERISTASITGSRRRKTEPVLPSTRRSSSQKTPQNVIPRPPSSVHSTAVTLAKMDEIIFPRAQRRNSDPVQDKDTLTEILPQESSPSSIQRTPPDVSSAPFAPKIQPCSSPGFQTQVRVPAAKDLAREEVKIVSRPNSDSLSVLAKAVQPKEQAAKRKTSFNPPSDSHLSSIGPPSRPPAASVSPSSPRKDCPVSAPNLQNRLGTRPTEPPIPQPPITVDPPLPNAEPSSPLALSRIAAPNPPPAPDPVPKPKPTNQPASTKIIPTIPVPKPSDETVEVLSSQQPPSSPPPEPATSAPQPRKRNTDSLPAFTKVVPTTRTRSALKKSTSDTSTMQSSSAMRVSDGKEKEKGKEKSALPEVDPGGKDESASLWNKEAWDLFGCGRDGVECTYEEFKRKEGLL